MIARDARIFVAGHRGLVGAAITRALRARGHQNLLLRTRDELDLRDQHAVDTFVRETRPDLVILAAAKVGGIVANNTLRGDFIQENLQIQTNVISSSFAAGVKSLLFLGSSCIYPKLAPQPIREEHLLTGPLEVTNEPYAVAKIAGLTHCRALSQQYGVRYFTVMPTNVYGPGDRYDLEHAHVIAALMLKFHLAKKKGEASVTTWGTGKPLREFIYADDLAEACLVSLEKHDGVEPLNIGSGVEFSIRDLADKVRAAVGYSGDIVWDTSRPDGTPRKILDSTKIRALGWTPRTDFEDGLRKAYAEFLERHA